MRKCVALLLCLAFWFGIQGYFCIKIIADEVILEDDFEKGLLDEYWRKHEWNRGGEIEVDGLPGGKVLRFLNIAEDSGLAIQSNDSIDLSAGRTEVESWLYYDHMGCGFCFIDTPAKKGENFLDAKSFGFFISTDGLLTASANEIPGFSTNLEFPVPAKSWNHYAMVFEPKEPDIYTCDLYFNGSRILTAELDIEGMEPENMHFCLAAYSGPITPVAGAKAEYDEVIIALDTTVIYIFQRATRSYTLRVRPQSSRLVSMPVSNPPMRHWQRWGVKRRVMSNENPNHKETLG